MLLVNKVVANCLLVANSTYDKMNLSTLTIMESFLPKIQIGDEEAEINEE